MATIYKDKKSPYYFIRFMHKGKVYRESTGKKKKAEAEAVLHQRETEVKNLVGLDESFQRIISEIDCLPEEGRDKTRQKFSDLLLQGLDSQLAITDAWDTWVKTPKKRDPAPKTLKGYKTRWDEFTKWVSRHHPGVTLMHQVTLPMAKAYAAHVWGKGFSPDTYNQYIKILRLIFKGLETEAGLYSNVWAKVVTKSLEPQGRRELKPDELAKVIENAGPDMRAMFAVGIYTGMRLGDVCLLRWVSVHFDRAVIEHIPMKTKRTGKAVTITLHPVIEAILYQQHQGKVNGDEFVFPELARRYQVDNASVSKQIQQHFLDCGIQTTEPANGHRKKAVIKVGFHSLRALSNPFRHQAGA